MVQIAEKLGFQSKAAELQLGWPRPQVYVVRSLRVLRQTLPLSLVNVPVKVHRGFRSDKALACRDYDTYKTGWVLQATAPDLRFHT